LAEDSDESEAPIVPGSDADAPGAGRDWPISQGGLDGWSAAAYKPASTARICVLTNSGTIAGRRAPQKGAECADCGNEPKKECAVSEVIVEYKSWVCLICGWIYNEEEGLPEEGIAAGTRFADIPEDWRCPLCDVSKAEFTVVEF
jgi:rubredoxin